MKKMVIRIIIFEILEEREEMDDYPDEIQQI